MTIEKLKLTEPEKKLDAFGHLDSIRLMEWYRQTPTRYDLHKTESKINELIDAVNDIQQVQLEHIKEFKDHRHLQGLTCPERDKLIKKLDYLESWINNHEKNILPRFKEEILMCLEDDEFRIKLKERLGYNPVKHTWDEPSLAYKATAINRMQSEEPCKPLNETAPENTVIEEVELVMKRKDFDNSLDYPGGLKAYCDSQVTTTSQKPDKRQAEDELEKAIQALSGSVIYCIDSNDPLILKLRELGKAYKNWKEARGKNK